MDADLIFGLMAGIGLSAACGFRIFVPLLAIGIANQAGHLDLAQGFEWIASPPAMIIFGVATLCEIAAYYIPWVDNALDSVAVPASVVAGTVVTASCVGNVDPVLQWTAAAILGGGTAGVVQVGTTLTRAASSTLTGGLGNPVVSTGEAAGSVMMASMAIFIPVLALATVVVVFMIVIRKIYGKMLAAKPVEVKIPVKPARE